MAQQKHLLKRQILELHLPATAEAAQWQAEISRVYRQRVIPLLDRYCTALSEPDRLYRIESLTVDLGYVDLHQLESTLIDKLDQALYQALAEQIGAQRQRTGGQDINHPLRTQLELFVCFIHNGSLPWWADATQPKLLATNLQELIAAAPSQLRSAVRAFSQDQRCLQRLVTHYPDELLGKLAGMLLPTSQAALSQAAPALIRLLQEAMATAGGRPAQIRSRAWRHLLQLATAGNDPAMAPLPFYQTLLGRVAPELDTTYSALLSAIHQRLAADGAALPNNELYETLQNLYRNAAGDIAASAWPTGQMADLPAALRRPLRQLPASVQAELLIRLKTVASKQRAQGWDLAETLQPIGELLRLDLLAASQWPTHGSPDAAAELLALLIAALQQAMAAAHDSHPATDQPLAASSSQPLTVGLSSSQVSAIRTLLQQTIAVMRKADLGAHRAQPLAQWQPFISGMGTDARHALCALLQEATISALNQTFAVDLSANERDALLTLLQSTTSEAISHATTADEQSSKLLSHKPLPSFSADQAADRGIYTTPTPEPTPFAFSVSTADELYIHNAGLVILWPFFGHFFGRLGLLTNKQFKDTASKQRATGLLQYLATTEPWPLEYLLPLNKVLCGMELREVFDFGSPLSNVEREECANLLQAIIAQASILRTMSPAGLQGTFLLRPGVLSTRDGAWLLRVERETYDIVLDRFPWGWGWVKLPWMEAPLQVEW